MEAFFSHDVSCFLQDPEVPLFLLRNVCFFCDTNGIGALKTCFETANPDTLPFNFAHILITLIANVSNRGCITVQHYAQNQTHTENTHSLTFHSGAYMPL